MLQHVPWEGLRRGVQAHGSCPTSSEFASAAQPACCACSSLPPVSPQRIPSCSCRIASPLQACGPSPDTVAAYTYHSTSFCRHCCCLQILLHIAQQRQQLHSSPRRYFSTQPGGPDKWGGGAAPWQQGGQGPLPGLQICGCCLQCSVRAALSVVESLTSHQGLTTSVAEQHPGSKENEALYLSCWWAAEDVPSWRAFLWAADQQLSC